MLKIVLESLHRVIFALLFSCTALVARPVDVLFVLQDAGETQGLLPSIELMQSEGRDFAILVGGVAEEQLSKIPSLRGCVVHFSDFGACVDKSWGRSQKLGSDVLKTLTKSLEAKKVVTGVAFEMHGQILQAYEQLGASTFSFWDNINPSGTDPYFATAQKVALVAQNLFVPTAAFLSVYPKGIVVGQPSLEKWGEVVKGFDLAAIRKKLPFLGSKRVIVFVGGYGAEYEEAFNLLVSALPQLSNYDVLVSFHPKMGGVFERSRLASFSNARLLEDISTQEAVAISDAVICHQSTVGIQAASIGKQVCYLIPPKQSYTNPVIEKEMAPRCTSGAELALALNEPFVRKGEFFSELGLPRGSARLIAETLAR